MWFSIAQGIVTETAYGMIHEAQIKDLQFLVTGNGFFDEEKVATQHKTEYLYIDAQSRPLSLAYKVTNTSNNDKYVIEKHLFTDPDRQTLFLHVIFTAQDNNITPYILINPHMKNSGRHDVAYVGKDYLNAREDNDLFMSLRLRSPENNVQFVKTSAGFEGVSDGWQDLKDNGVMDWNYPWADCGGGNVVMMAQLPTLNKGETRTFDIVVGFGNSHQAAMAEADASLQEGYTALLNKYNSGWQNYLGSLSNLSAMTQNTGDGGKLLYASAMVLKALEDKQNPGALIASLSIPWGDTTSANESATGYRAVWPRDFYQSAMALLALGDTETPRVAFNYLPKVQVLSNLIDRDGFKIESERIGWFLQKTHVDGGLEWLKLQMDQTAMPIMLGWKLWKNGVLSDSDIVSKYWSMIKPAAEFLANGGRIKLTFPDGNTDEYTVTPPWTRLERWEEQKGYSPSTEAAEITGLLVAADIASTAHDPYAAGWYEKKADQFADNLPRLMFTTTGVYKDGQDNGKYYLRITPNGDPNDGQPLDSSNGKPGLDERKVLDAGFLELVRYGVRAANDGYILDSLAELDDTSLPEDLRVKYLFTFGGQSDLPGWRRYSGDGYGERTDNGCNWGSGEPAQRGRVWPIFTGERGHFELERIKAQNKGNITPQQLNDLKATYVRAMEGFANEGLMLPEQVFDG